MASTIQISVLADTRKAQSGIRGVQSSLGGMSSIAGKAGKALAAGVAVGAAAVGALAVASIKSASDAEQSLGATQTVFGKYADAVVKDSNKAATQFGLSANEYRTNANLIGSLFKNQGVATDELAGKTKGMVSQAADLAATFGGTTSDAVGALGSAFKGEFDSLEKYGISLKQSTVNTEAMRIAGVKTATGFNKLSTAQQTAAKSQATSNLIMKQSADSTGAFGRESDTLAQQQQVLAAQFENVKAKIGAVLLPVLVRIATYISNNLVPTGKNLRDTFATIAEKVAPIGAAFKTAFGFVQDNIGAFQIFGAALAGAAAAFVLVGGAVKAFTIVSTLLNIVLAANPIGIVVVAIGALIGVMVLLYQRNETVRNALNTLFEYLKTNVPPILNALGELFRAVFERIKQVVQTAVGIIQSLWSRFGATIVSFITNSLNNVRTIVDGAMQYIKGVIKLVTSVIKGDWSGAWDAIKQILRGAWTVLRGIVSQGINVLKTLLKAGWAVIRGGVTSAWNSIKSFFTGVWAGIRSVFTGAINNIKSGLSRGWDTIKSAATNAFNALKNAVSTALDNVLTVVRALPGRILLGLATFGSVLINAGRNIVEGLINGVRDMAGALVDAAKGVVNGAINAAKNLLGINSPSRVFKKIGQQTIQGLMIGIEDGKDGVKDEISDVVKILTRTFNKRIEDNKKAAAATKRAIASLANETKALLKNAGAREKIYKRLAAAEKVLADKRKQMSDYSNSVRDSALGGITGLNSAFNADAMVASLRDRLEKIKQYNALLKTLIAGGLRKDLVDQLAQAGVEGGLATATAIAAGGAGAISDFNAVQAELVSASTALGTTTSNNMYLAGVQAAQGLVKGLNSQRKTLEKTFKKLAQSLVDAMRKALKIKSPSRVFDEIGRYTVAGLAQGLGNASALATVKKASTGMTGAIEAGYRQPVLNKFNTNGSTKAGSGNTYYVTVKVDDSMSTEQQGVKFKKAIEAAERAGIRTNA